MKNVKNLSLKNILLMILTAYMAVGYIVFAFTKKIIPIPLGEGAALIYGYILKENFVMTALLIAVVVALTALLFFFSIKNGRELLWLRIVTAVIFLSDLAVHQYVFFKTPGMSWGYMVSSILDFEIVICLLMRDKVKKG